MWCAKRDVELGLMHQTIPLGAVAYNKGSPREARLIFSQSYCYDGDDSSQKQILVQLLYYKCTSEPIHAVVVDPSDGAWEVSY